ncbi:MAG: acetyltransferase [Paenibacillus sp.]|jgi:pimeloyl-ACP methyl ester carboxylesterase|uniref:alpha/beta fold hydrolase n=1 Tax=Paenibacillus sp. GCM10012303 TaxID=3317340 RepID=UPI0029EA6748|nr:acetyltransferase [Paenibacillus sp.]
MMKRNKMRLTTVVLSLVLLVIVLFSPPRTPPIKDAEGRILPDSIAEIEQVVLGGVKQSILIRGADRSKPVLLFLHGGPGYPQIAFARKYQQELERFFVVVNWDQRGSGQSYHFDLTADDMQVSRLIEDTHELTRLLQQRFGQSKIFLAGHSWGSLLGTWTVQKYPDLYYAYIGIGQVADQLQGEKKSYEFVLSEAYRRNNRKAISELESIGAPPYRNPRKDTTLQRKWVAEFGGSERLIRSGSDLLKGIFLSPEYNGWDGIRLAFGNSFSAKTILAQTEHTNLLETASELQVPVFIAMGRHDYMTPSEVAYSYYENLRAPSKQFVWFEQSAHFPHFEEQDRFTEWMIEIKKTIMEAG